MSTRNHIHTMHRTGKAGRVAVVAINGNDQRWTKEEAIQASPRQGVEVAMDR